MSLSWLPLTAGSLVEAAALLRRYEQQPAPRSRSELHFWRRYVLVAPAKSSETTWTALCSHAKGERLELHCDRESDLYDPRCTIPVAVWYVRYATGDIHPWRIWDAPDGDTLSAIVKACHDRANFLSGTELRRLLADNTPIRVSVDNAESYQQMGADAPFLAGVESMAMACCNLHGHLRDRKGQFLTRFQREAADMARDEFESSPWFNLEVPKPNAEQAAIANRHRQLDRFGSIHPYIWHAWGGCKPLTLADFAKPANPPTPSR
jgi:hypothetical protein